MVASLIERFTYAGSFLVLFLAGLGAPIPEEVPVDGIAAIIGVPLGFGVAFLFTDQLDAIMRGVHRVERILALVAMVVLAAVIAVVAYRKSRAP